MGLVNSSSLAQCERDLKLTTIGVQTEGTNNYIYHISNQGFGHPRQSTENISQKTSARAELVSKEIGYI